MAKLWGTLKAQAVKSGHPLGANTQANDLWVCAIAMYHDAPLLTANRRHFEDFPGLSLLN
jgi:tRNA(fMet)-specific endonuclease VapC